jgi:sarcosine/dimethylglycine N-methyltransferase
MTHNYSSVVNTARDYYNSGDADNFYHTVWGGEDIHIGLYQHPEEPIREASRRTVARIAEKLDNLDPGAEVLDLGAGYGGAARFLAREFGCKVVALNLSETENERNRQKNREQGLDHLVKVVDGNFEELPFPDHKFDVIWSQDAFLHTDQRDAVVAEAVRVLKPGGEFIFTDPMRTDDCPEDVLQPILDRIHLSDLGSPGFYRDAAAEHGLEEVGFDHQTPQLVRHYSRVLQETERREDQLSEVVAPQYLEKMKKGLKHWVDGGRNGHLAWGIFHFKKNGVE